MGQSRDMHIAKFFLLESLCTIRDISHSKEFEVELSTFQMFLLSIKNVKELQYDDILVLLYCSVEHLNVKVT